MGENLQLPGPRIVVALDKDATFAIVFCEKRVGYILKEKTIMISVYSQHISGMLSGVDA